MKLSEKIWIVYCHENKINGKKYVGITSQGAEKRWKNGHGYVSSPYFNSAVQKYGWDNFNHLILFDNLTEQEAKSKEQELIKDWNLRDRKRGYNLTDGGDGVLGIFISEEKRKQMSECMKGEKHPFYGKKLSKEFREAISKGRRGIKFSDTHRKHLSESHKGKSLSKEQKQKISDNSINKRKVICLETKQIFNSIVEVSAFYNKNARHVSECCNGSRHTWNGYHWQYYQEDNERR